jgi:hypothetical protein
MPQNNPFAPPEWDSNDATILRSFFLSPTGKKLIHRLRNDRPDLDVKTSERASLSAAEVAGYEGAIDNLFQYLVREVDEKELSATYPDLSRDELWGKELQPAAFKLPELTSADAAVKAVAIDLENC